MFAHQVPAEPAGQHRDTASTWQWLRSPRMLASLRAYHVAGLDHPDQALGHKDPGLHTAHRGNWGMLGGTGPGLEMPKNPISPWKWGLSYFFAFLAFATSPEGGFRFNDFFAVPLSCKKLLRRAFSAAILALDPCGIAPAQSWFTGSSILQLRKELPIVGVGLLCQMISITCHPVWLANAVLCHRMYVCMHMCA
eukprot:g27132.t1